MKPARTTPELELASAYLDDEVTAVERARVEASPELLAQVASMRRVSAAVAAVSAPVAAARETAIAAALSVFDGLDTVASNHVRNVVSLASRRRWPNAVMATAAAVVLLGAVGISVLNRSSDDKAETSSREVDAKVDTAAAEDAIAAGVPTNADGEVLQAVESALVIDNPDQLRDLTIPLPPTADTAPAETTSGGGDEGDTAYPTESANVDAIACMTDDQVFLADIYYQGTLAIAARDTVTGVTEAIDATCNVLARVNP